MGNLWAVLQLPQNSTDEIIVGHVEIPSQFKACEVVEVSDIFDLCVDNPAENSAVTPHPVLTRNLALFALPSEEIVRKFQVGWQQHYLQR